MLIAKKKLYQVKNRDMAFLPLIQNHQESNWTFVQLFVSDSKYIYKYECGIMWIVSKPSNGLSWIT